MLARGIAIGAAGLVGAYLVWKLGPSLAKAAEPVVREAIKTNIKTMQRAQEAYAHLSEVAEDAYAEAWSDLNREAAEREATAAEDTAV